MGPLTIHSLPQGLRRPVLITAFSGWNDAAEAATTAARYLATSFQAEKFAEIDPEEFYHFGLSRPYVRYKSGSETEREIVQGHDAIALAAGIAPRFFRPPWGMTNLAVFPVLRRLHTPCVFWTVQPERRRAAPPALQLQRVREGVKPGAILDLHDADGVPGAGGRTVQALPALITALREAGYTLARLRDLL